MVSRALRLAAVALVAVGLFTVLSRPVITRIFISKHDGRIRLLDASGAAQHEYPAIFGRNLEGTKEHEGDQRTPEGEYFVCVKNPNSKFHLSLGLNYPNTADAKRGLTAGRITTEQYAAIEAAERARQRPPWDTPLGGEIFIHGHGDRLEGTLGCVAVSDPAIEEIYALVDVGTAVVITP